MGRPQLQIDALEVADLASKGFTVSYIAVQVGCCEQTLYDRFSDALKKGRARRDGCLQEKQFQLAMNGNPTMCIWLGKQWLGQSDKQEITGAGGGPLKHEFIDPSKLTDEQLEQVRAAIESASVGTSHPR